MFHQIFYGAFAMVACFLCFLTAFPHDVRREMHQLAVAQYHHDLYRLMNHLLLHLPLVDDVNMSANETLKWKRKLTRPLSKKKKWLLPLKLSD